MILDRQIQPQIHSIDKITYLPYHRYNLSNGIEVYSINGENTEVTRIEIVFRSGAYYSNKKLVSGFTASMMAEGTSHKNSEIIAEIIDAKGAYLEISSDKDFATASLFCLTKYAEALIPLYFEILTEPVFPEHELQVQLNNKLQSLLINNQKVGFIARNRFLSLITGENHPYGRFAYKEDYKNLTRQDLVEFYNSHFNFRTAKFFISGNISENIIRSIDKYFGEIHVNQTNASEKYIDLKEDNEKSEQRISVENAVQNAIRIGHHTINRLHPDYHSIKIVNTILGGYFGSRLMTNIREDKGYTYGIGSAIASYKNNSFFFISSEVKSESTNDVLIEINKEIEKLQSKKITNEELELVCNYLTGSLQRSFDGIFAQADRLRDSILMDFDFEYYGRYLDKIKSIEKSEILRISSEYFSLNNSKTLVVGKI